MRAGVRPRTLMAGDAFGWKSMLERVSNEETVVVAADRRLLVMSQAQFRAVKVISDPEGCGRSASGL